MTLTAFVARSFDSADEQRIRPIRTFLESFRKAGFLCEEAEAAEVESVSAKVRRMIDEREVFVGFFTKKHAIHHIDSRLRERFRFLLGRSSPDRWTAPSWVLQESGYALGAKKKLILLREDGVEIPGLQGDLEYIPFNSSNPAMIFSRLSEMINDLLAKAAGREVRTEVTERQETAEAVHQSPDLKQEDNVVDAEEQASSIVAQYFEIREASEKRDLSRMHSAWEEGNALIVSGHAGKVDSLWWECYYLEQRYEAGDSNALDELRRIHRENPEQHDAPAVIAKLLSAAGEHDEAASLYLEVSNLPDAIHRAWYLANAAKQLKELGRFEEGLSVAEESLRTATGEVRTDAISILYELLKSSGQTYFAFARAEAFLHQNPQLRLRFDLGLDYRRHGSKTLALYHFKFQHDRNTEESGALHNLALLYADCELPISSVTHYKGSIALGETLSSANLGFMYLDAGMVDEARDLIRAAILVEPHDVRVEECSAEISVRTQKESVRQIELLKDAANERDFFISMGNALQTPIPDINGVWKFPFGELTLTRFDNKISGAARIKKPEGHNYLSALLGGATAGPTVPRVELYSLKGVMAGAVCEFTLAVSDEDQATHPGLGSILGAESRSGFIVFSTEEKSGTYVELKDEKLGGRKKIMKLEK